MKNISQAILKIKRRAQYRAHGMARVIFAYGKAMVGGVSRRHLWRQLYIQETCRHPGVLEAVLKNSLVVCLTYKCNINCKFCYARGLEEKMPGYMSLEEFKRLIVWAKSKKFSFFRFIGGEPTTHPQFSQILDMTAENGMSARLSTNNVFNEKIRNEMKRRVVKYLTINYVFDTLDAAQRERFEDNLSYYKRNKIPFKFSYVLDLASSQETKLYEHSKRYSPVDVRSNIPMPGLAGQTTIQETESYFAQIAERIFFMQKKFMDINVPFYIYMPVFRCLFSDKQWDRLKNFFPNMLFTRCFVGAMGNYAAMTVVNPDLSIYPCPAVYVKGPDIFSFDSRKQISDYFKGKLVSVLSRPAMQKCSGCDKFNNFLNDLKNESTLKKSFDQSICQSGCLNYHMDQASACYME